MPFRLPQRTVLALIGLTCFALLAFAWFLQYGPDKQQPCPLCILQRYVFIALGTTCLLASIHGPKQIGQLIYLGLADSLSTTGAGLAVWQQLKGSSMTSCLADPIGDFVNGLPSANWWPEFLFATGGCADKYPPVLGVTVPVWALVWFVGLSLCFGWIIVLTLRKIRHR